MSFSPATGSEFSFTVATPFGGCGGGALGAQRAMGRFRGMSGRVDLIGGYDSDPYACNAFRYLTGVEQACVDARTVTAADLRRLWGPLAPYAIISSPPCVGATALISHAKASTDHYVEMNGLMLPSTEAILEAYGPDPQNLPAYFIFENVPGLGSEKRGGGMLKKLFALFKRYKCFAIHKGHHNARHVGGGAQNRVRLLIIVRNIVRVPVFLYKPPYQEGLVVGDVLGPLPVPDDPRGGPMHRTTKRMSFLNRLRLWAIEAGKDWRSLRDRRDALAMKIPSGAHANLYRVAAEGEASPVVTCATRPGGGALSYAAPVPVDLAPREGTAWHPNVLGVLDPTGHSGVITGEGRPTNGAFSVAAPVPIDLVPREDRFNGSLGVLAPDQHAVAVTGEAAPSTGAFSVAAPVPIDLVPQADNPDLHANKYVVLPWDGQSKTVTTATRVGSGAMSVAQPLDLATADSAFHHGMGPGRWGVLSPLDPSGTVTSNARVATGPFSVAAPIPVDLVPNAVCFPSAYGVLDKGKPSSTVKSTSCSVGNGAYAVADDVPGEGPLSPIRLELNCAPHAGAYGVQRFEDPAKTVLAHGNIDNTVASVADPREVPRYVILSCAQVEQIVSGEIPVPFAIVDPRNIGDPLAIVDDLTKPAYRIVRSTSAKGKIVEKREPVTVVLVSRDGTWHRELTTAELAVLQHFPFMHKGAPLDFGGGVTEQRGVIGNAIPAGVMEAVFGQIIISSLASQQSFFLAPSDWDVWVQGLRDEGYEIIDAGHRPLDFGGGVVLDDGAVMKRKAWRAKKRKTAQQSAPRPQIHAVAMMQ